MASSINPHDSDKLHNWIVKKPLAEAVSWTAREKFYLIGAILRFGTDWRCIVQTLKHGGEPYRPSEWYTSKTCERQLKMLVNSQSKTIKSLPVREMLEHIAESLRIDFMEELKKSNKSYLDKYCSLTDILKRIRQGNLSRNEINCMYSQARRNEFEGKQYLEHLKSRQNSILALVNSSSGPSGEPLKLNPLSAPLLTSLLRSRNTTPSNRNANSISSITQSPGGTSRTRSGKLLPLSSPTKTIQGTPTLSKLLEAPANPYIPSPSQSSQKNKPNELIGTDLLIGINSRKENTQSPSLNRVRIDSMTTPGSLNQLNKSDLLYAKRPMSRSPVSAVKNGSKVTSSIVNLLSDSENEEDINSPTHNNYLKNSFGEKKDSSGGISSRLEPRATRSQTRAEGGFKQLNDSQLSDGKKEHSTLRQHSEESLLTDTHLIDDVLFDIDQIEVEPLSSVQDEIITETPLKVTRSSIQRIGINSENLTTSRVNKKEISNQMLEEISANFVLNSKIKNVATDYKNLMVGQSQVNNSNNLTGCFVPVDGSIIKDTLLLRKDGQSFPNPGNTLTTFDGKLLRQKRIIELKGANIRCIDGRNDKKVLSFTNQPIVVVNKIKKPFNIKLAAELKDKTDFDPKKTIRLHGNSQNVTLLDNQCSFSDEVIIIDDDVNINSDDKEFPGRNEFLKLSPNTLVGKEISNITCNSKSIGFHIKSQNILDVSSKKNDISNEISNIDTNPREPNSRFVKELDFDFDQPSSLSDFYNGVEEIVEMHSFDNEELNSLIECSSLDNNEQEIRQNPTILDQSHSVSECDSTIEAFDTFAQITKILPKNTSNNIDILNKEPNTVKEDGKDLERSENVAQSDEIDDDDQVATRSVTSIPILQGVISDVMSKINSDRVAALNQTTDLQSTSINDIVEISSDEDDTLSIKNQLFAKLSEKNISKENDNVKIKKLNDDKLKIIEKNDKGIKSKIVTKKTLQTENTVSTEIKNTTTDNKCDKINIKSYTNKITATENVQLNKETEFLENEKKESEVSVALSAEITNKSLEKIESKDAELKKKSEIVIQVDDETLTHPEVIMSAKDSNEKTSEEIKAENKKEDQEQKMKDMKIKVAETKEFESEIMQRSKKNEEKEIKVAEIIILKEVTDNKEINVETDKVSKTKVKDNLMKKSTEIEEIKAKEAEVPKVSTIEVQNENELQKGIKLVEAQKAKEIEIERAEEAKKANALNLKEAEANKLKDLDLKKERDIEVQRIKEITEIRKMKEESELRNSKEIEMAFVTETKENEKNVAKMLETGPSKVKEDSVKINITEVSSPCGEIEVKLNNDTEIQSSKEKNVLTLEEQSKIIKKSERSTLEAKKINSSETELKESESEITKSKVDCKKVVEYEVKKNKEIHIVTRNRGLKVEEKLKESNLISKNVLTSLNKSAVPTIGGLSNLDNSLTSNYDNNKQTKNIEDENKPNNSVTNLRPVLNVNACERDSSINSSESVPEIGGKLRTRSSLLLKQSKILDTKSSTSIHKLNEQVSTSSDSEVLTSMSNFQHNTDLSKIESDYCTKKLTVSVVMLGANEVPVSKEKDDLCLDSTAVNQSELKPANNELLQKSTDSNVKLDKPVPKKRGRKRRVGVLSEQNRLSINVCSDEASIQTDATAIPNISSTSEIDPPAKRTRNSIGSIEQYISLNKRNKKALQILTDNVRNTYNIQTLENEIKNLPLEKIPVVKAPFEFQDITKKIDASEITKLSQLQIKLYMLSYNAIMLNKSTSTIFDDASNFQDGLYDISVVSQNAVDEDDDNEPFQKKTNLKKTKKTDDDSSDIEELTDFNFEEIGSSDTDCNDDDDNETYDADVDFNETPAELIKSIDFSSNDNSDIDYIGDSLSLKRKRKDVSSDDLSNYDDSDEYDFN